jgi:hypothetical protein
MELLTLRAAALRLGVCEPVARRLLAGYAVPVGSRKRYPLSAVERISERGGK